MTGFRKNTPHPIVVENELIPVVVTYAAYTLGPVTGTQSVYVSFKKRISTAPSHYHLYATKNFDENAAEAEKKGATTGLGLILGLALVGAETGVYQVKVGPYDLQIGLGNAFSVDDLAGEIEAILAEHGYRPVDKE